MRIRTYPKKPPTDLTSIKRGDDIVILVAGVEIGTISEPGRACPMYRSTPTGRGTRTHGTIHAALRRVIDTHEGATSS